MNRKPVRRFEAALFLLRVYQIGAMVPMRGATTDCMTAAVL
jgi:hypothetical protein